MEDGDSGWANHWTRWCSEGREDETSTGSYLERALQQLYPLELLCDREPQRAQNVLSVNAAEFAPRRETRQAARDARGRIAALANDESN